MEITRARLERLVKRELGKALERQRKEQIVARQQEVAESSFTEKMQAAREDPTRRRVITGVND